MKKTGLSLLTLLISTFAIAQTAMVRLQVQPVDAIVRINGKQVHNLVKNQLEPGTYVLEAWKLGYTYISDTIQVSAGDTLNWKQVLAITNPYKQYSQEFEAWRKTKVNNALYKSCLVLSDVGITCLTVAFLQNRVNGAAQQVDNALEDYQNATLPSDVTAAREKYDEYLSIYEKRKKNRKIALGVAIPSIVALYGVTVFAWTKVPKPGPKPTFHQDNPFANIRLQFKPNMLYPQQSQLGLTLNF